jgi:hypothetical protein
VPGRFGFVVFCLAICGPASGQDAVVQKPNTWQLRSPVKGAPLSPGMGYEASLVYDPAARRVIRWAGHNQGGGGEQNAETWTYDPVTARWELREPNLSPPGVCCAQQNVFDPVHGRMLRFKGFSGNHGWQWFREIYLNNSAVWSYDLARNTWRDMRSVSAPLLGPLRCASWDSDHHVAVVFGGEGAQDGTFVYDPHDNSWSRSKSKLQPPPRSGGNMAYDPVRKRHILFGTQFGNDPHTWSYDLVADEWTDLKPAVQPPGDLNDPVLAYDERNDVIVAHTRIVEASKGTSVVKGHYETWLYEPAANNWRKANPPDEPPGPGNRRRIMVAVPDQNLILMEDYVDDAARGERQQIWTYRHADAKATRPVLREFSVAHTKDGPLLEWRYWPGASDHVVFRGVGSKPWLADFKGIIEAGPRERAVCDDALWLKNGQIAWYYVRNKAPENKLGPPSQRVRYQPPLVEDVVVSVASPDEVKVTWTPPGKESLVYHVERAPVEVFSEDEIKRLRTDTPPLAEPSVGAVKTIGPFVRLTKQPLEGVSFMDTSVDLKKPATVDGKPLFTNRFRSDQLNADGKPYRLGVYAYRVIAQYPMAGVESGGGPYALTIPSSPQWVFSREDGVKCHLKWTANPETGLKGYRVYRMESPRLNGPGQKTNRLTAEPIGEPRFLDEAAGNVTRRYWIVAVDALGQEGYPSAPVWFERQYKAFYRPFTGEWHQ